MPHDELGGEHVRRERVTFGRGRLRERVQREDDEGHHGQWKGALHGDMLLRLGGGPFSVGLEGTARDGPYTRRGTVSRTSRPGVLNRKSVGAVHRSIEAIGGVAGAGP